MGINLTNFLSSRSKNRKMIDFQDLDHLDGLSISAVSANLYQNIRDDLLEEAGLNPSHTRTFNAEWEGKEKKEIEKIRVMNAQNAEAKK